MPGKVLSNRSLGAAVFIAALITYAGTVGYEYVWDDPYLIDRVRKALSTGEISRLFTTSFYVKTVNTARGNALAALGRYDEATRSYRDALAANESSGKPLVALGVLAARDGEFSRAVRLFTDAAEREPGLTEAFEGMGESYLALGMHGMAEGSFLRALEISPDNTRAAVKLGWFLLGTPADRSRQTAPSGLRWRLIHPSSRPGWELSGLSMCEGKSVKPMA